MYHPLARYDVANPPWPLVVRTAVLADSAVAIRPLKTHAYIYIQHTYIQTNMYIYIYRKRGRGK